MMVEPTPLRREQPAPLKCSGVGRDKDHAASLQFYFSRPVTDDEMRFLHEVMQRSAILVGVR